MPERNGVNSGFYRSIGRITRVNWMPWRESHSCGVGIAFARTIGKPPRSSKLALRCTRGQTLGVAGTAAARSAKVGKMRIEFIVIW